MKKVLATVAALGLVLGVSASAFALDQPGRASETESTTAPKVAVATAPGVSLWSVSGQWVLAGAYLSNGMGAPGKAAVAGRSESHDAFYIYSFKVLPTLQINDKVSVKGEIRFADRDVFGVTNSVYQNSSDENGGRVADTYLLYMEWVSPVGKTRFGRTPAGAWGSKFLDSSAQGDRLMLWGNWMPENWGMLLFTQKVTEQDAADGRNISDQDKDAYYIDLSYKADIGKTVGALWFVRDATGGIEPYTSTNLWIHGVYAFGGNFGLEYEVNYGFGEASSTKDQSSLGVYADLSYTMDAWTFGGLVIYASGDSDLSDNSSEAAMSSSTGLGKDFNPFQIMTGDYMNILNGDNPLAGDAIHPAILRGGGNAGARALGLYTKFAMSPKTTLNGEIGYFQADEAPTGFDNHYGTEIGVGLAYKLYDNLTYNAHFSYLWTGDYFEDATSSYPAQDIYLVAHALSMTF